MRVGVRKSFGGQSFRAWPNSAVGSFFLLLLSHSAARCRPSGNPPEVRTAPSLFLAKTATRTQAGPPSAPFPNSSTTPRGIRFAACMKKYPARHAMPNRFSPTLGRRAPIVTPTFIAVSSAPTARSATRFSAGGCPSNRWSSTSTDFRCSARMPWCNARSVIQTPRSEIILGFRRHARPVT